MARYSIDVEKKAKIDLAKIYKSGNKGDIKRVEKIFQELEAHPMTGIGEPEELKYELSGRWSRRINSKDRIIYTINDEKVIVTVVSARGHYNDK